MKKYPTALVLGLGASGAAAGRLLLAEGSQVCIIDRRGAEDLSQAAAALRALGAEVILGCQELPSASYAVCVVSPGIPVHSDWISALKLRGQPIISELELGWSRANSRVLAISGSNGKSTLVKLCATALASAGRRVAVAGNYGPPVSQVVSEQPDCDWLILEVSSFQLETLRAFRPDLAILLNLYPNHLDRHADMAAYERLKISLFRQMRAQDIGIVPDDLAARIARLSATPNRWITFGLSAAADFRYQDETILDGGRVQLASLRGTVLANEILGLSAAAASAALCAAGETAAALQSAAQTFQTLPHRIQSLGQRQQVRFVNDSKATNLAAMLAALKICPAPIRLIAGGTPKHEPYEAAKTLLAEKVAGVYLIGAAAPAMFAAWQAEVPCELCHTLDAAVGLAWSQSQAGDTILLSPACASFDQFKNFEQRGETFSALVQALAAKK